MVGYVAILLTVASIWITISVFKSFVDQYSEVLNNLGGGIY